MKNVNFYINIPTAALKERKRYVIYTPALDLSTSGRTLKEAKKRFSEAVGVFFEELIEKDTLDTALKDLGWQRVKRRWQPPVVVRQGHERIKVPALA